MQTLPFPKIHIETIFGQTRKTKWASCTVTGVWSSGRGGEATRRAASALVVSLQEPWKGKQAGAAMWAVAQDRRTVKRETKRREKWLRSCHGLPACRCTCLLSGTRPSKGLNSESVNSYKHTPMYMCADSLTHTYSHTRTAVCPQSTCTHTHVRMTAVWRSFTDEAVCWLQALCWFILWNWITVVPVLQVPVAALQVRRVAVIQLFQKWVIQAVQTPETLWSVCFILLPASSNGHTWKWNSVRCCCKIGSTGTWPS